MNDQVRKIAGRSRTIRPAGILIVLLAASAPAGQTRAQQPSVPSFPSSGPRPGVPSPAASAEPSNTQKTSTIRGRVVRRDNGVPISGARVSTGATDTFTDDEGRFELRGLTQGRYTVFASMSGFVSTYFGQGRGGEGPRPIELAAGEVVDGVAISMPPGGVIAGVVRDRFGEPLSRAPVTVFRQRYEDGERRLVRESSSSPMEGRSFGVADLTDDQGAFRLFGLVPGTYYLAAGDSSPWQRSRNDSFGPFEPTGVVTFFPGAIAPSGAAPIVLSEGQEIGGLSFAVTAAQSATIRGVARTADGRVARMMRLVRHTELGGSLSDPVRLQGDGSFSIPDLPPGAYTLFAREGDDVAMTDVTLNGDDAFVSLTLRPGYSMTGRVVFADGSPPAPGTNALVRFRHEETSVITAAVVRRDWTFQATGLIGRQRLVVGVPGWTVRGVDRAGSDITDLPFDVQSDQSGIRVVLTTRLTTLDGAVLDARGQAMADATVVIFADDPALWVPRNRYHRRLRPDQNGRFTVRLPAGRYLAIAIDAIESGEDTNPDVLENLARRATRVALAEGESRTVRLRAVEGQ